MRKYRIWYAVICAVVLLLYILADRKEPLVFFIGLLLLPVATGILQLFAMREIEAEFSIRSICRAGDQAALEITLNRANRVAMGAVSVQFHQNNKMYGEETEKTFHLIPTEKKEQNYKYDEIMKDCGSVWTELESVDFYDMLGLFHWRKVYNRELETLVCPAQLQLNLELRRRPETRTTGEFYDPYRKGQDVSEVADLRDYQEGDSMGSIHWKLSSKLDHMVVREFGYPANYSILILYDMMKESDGTQISNERNNAVLALTLAVSHAMLELNLDHEVGRVAEGTCQSVPVHSESTHEKMMYHLLCRQIPEKKSRGDALDYLLRSNVRNTYTKLIYITPEYDESMVRQISRDLDMTILQVTENQPVSSVETQEYSVIAIDAAEYRNKTYTISI